MQTIKWSPCGNMLAVVSSDASIKVTDLKIGKIVFSSTTPDRGKPIILLSYPKLNIFS